MKNLIPNKTNNKKGFTLTELIIVGLIIVVLAVVMFPTLSSYAEKARQRTDLSSAMHVVRAASIVVTEYSDEIKAIDYDKTFSVQWSPNAGTIGVYNLGNTVNNGGSWGYPDSVKQFQADVVEEISKLAGMPIRGESEVARDQTFTFSINAETGTITVSQSTSDWNASGRWITEIGVAAVIN